VQALKACDHAIKAAEKVGLVEADGQRHVEPDHNLLAPVRDLQARGYSTRMIARRLALEQASHAIAWTLRRLASDSRDRLRRQVVG
jgi:hypothetical protein